MASSMAVGKLLMAMGESRKGALDYKRRFGLFGPWDLRFASPVPFSARTFIFVWEVWIPNFDTQWTWIYGCDLFFPGCRSSPFRRSKHNFVHTLYKRDTPRNGSDIASKRKC